MKRRAILNPIKYFAARTKMEDRGYLSPCWIWRLCLDRKGYGDCHYEGRHTRAHRAAYLIFVGPLSEGLHVDHLCHVKACCNPEHLEAVTDRENKRRAAVFREPWRTVPDARREFCASGRHRLSDDNRYVEMREGKVRSSGCIECRRERHRLYMRNWSARNGAARAA